MKSSFEIFQNVAQAVTHFFGIGPTTAQTRQAPNTQPEQAQNQLAMPSMPITLTDFSTSLSHHGYFILPLELFTQIFQILPSMKNLYSIENLYLRVVSKPFYLAWENAAKNLFFSSKPAIHHLGLEQGCNTLHEQQQAEIKYLIENKAAILKLNNNDPRLINAFAKLALLENNSSLVAYHVKEKCLNSLNETIIRIRIAETPQSYNPTGLYLHGRHLTRFPSGIISDASLSEFWKKITLLQASNNHLTTLPDTIGQCAALLRLDVENNQLTTLPDTIGQCAALRYLYLTQNKLTALPNGLRDDIIFHDEYRYPINKAQCLALQKKALINTEETQEPSPMRFR